MYYRKGTFITVPNKQYLVGQKPIVLAVYFWICSFADDMGECYPSRKRLSKDCGVSIKTIDVTLKKLEELSLIEKIKRPKLNGDWQSNLYQIIVLDAFDEEIPSVKNDTTPSVNITLPSVKNDTLTKTTITKENTITTNEQSSEIIFYGKSLKDKQIDEIIKEFEFIDLKNKNNYGRPPQRKACDFLIENYTYEMVISVIQKVLPFTNNKPRYDFPFVSTPHQLMENWEKIKSGMLIIKEKKVGSKNQVAF